MTYQPNLFIRNIGNAGANKVYELVSNFQFGKISAIEIITFKKKEICAVIKMEQWNIRHTECTRIMLSQGKSISLYHSDDNKCWKIYAYNEQQQQINEEKMLLQKKKQADAALKKEMLNREIIRRTAEETRRFEEETISRKLKEEEEETSRLKEEEEEWNERKHVDLDYGDIATYKGDTTASRKLQKILLKYKV